ncbi:MAG: oligosaccharide flippase family protein [Bacteroidales bacterium]|nr:oligosaccharide flippase family protein [Bacteroidales bacterium]
MKKLLKSEFVKNSAILTGGTGLAQLIPILISPILTRLFTPEDYGILGVFNSVVAVFAVMAAWGYDQAIMLPKLQKNSVNLLALSLIASGITSLFLFLIFLLFNNSVANLLGNKQIEFWLFFVPLVVFFRGAYESISIWLNKYKEYKSIATTKVLTRTVTATGQILGGVAKIGAAGLIGSVVLGTITGNGLLFIQHQKKLKEQTKKDISIPRIKYLFKRYQKFPTYYMPSSLLNSFSLQIPIFILSGFFMESVVGLYVLGHRILSMPLNVIGRSIGNVFYQQASSIKSEPDKLKKLAYKTFRSLILIGLLPLGILAGFGDIIFGFVFGENWIEAGKFAMVIAPWMILNFSSSPISRIITLKERQEWSLIINLLLLLIRISPLIIGAVFLYSDNVLNVIILYSIFNLVFWMWFNIFLLKQVGVSPLIVIKDIIIFMVLPISMIFILRILLGIEL